MKKRKPRSMKLWTVEEVAKEIEMDPALLRRRMAELGITSEQLTTRQLGSIYLAERQARDIQFAAGQGHIIG